MRRAARPLACKPAKAHAQTKPRPVLLGAGTAAPVRTIHRAVVFPPAVAALGSGRAARATFRRRSLAGTQARAAALLAEGQFASDRPDADAWLIRRRLFPPHSGPICPAPRSR